jgi:hypothetical protein
MFKQNVGGLDRIIRVAAGVAGLVFFATNPTPLHWWGLIGVVPLLTGSFARCPLYSVLGVSTCRTAPHGR